MTITPASPRRRAAPRRRGVGSRGDIGRTSFHLDHLWIAFCLLLYSSFYWWGRIELGPLRAPFATLLIPGIGLVWFIARAGRRHAEVAWRHASAAPLGLLIWALALSLLFSGSAQATPAVLAELIFYVLLYVLLATSVTTLQAVGRITLVLAGMVGLLAAEGLVRFLVLHQTWRLGAGDVHPATNMGAFMFYSALTLVLAKLVHDRDQTLAARTALGVLAMVLGGALLFSYSRGAWLAFLVASVVMGLYRKRLLVLAAGTAVVLGPLLPDAVVTRAGSTLRRASGSVVLAPLDPSRRSAEVENTVTLRLSNWGRVAEDIVERPLTGRGVGHYHGEVRGREAPHNAYMRLWGEGGVLALVAFGWFLTELLRGLRTAVDRAPMRARWLPIGYLSLIASFTVYLVLGDWPYQVYFWTFCGLAAATLSTVRTAFSGRVAPDYVWGSGRGFKRVTRVPCTPSA